MARLSFRSSAGSPSARRSAARAAPVGVAVDAGADAQAHLAELADRPLVALAFAKFADGRAFSYARLLRDRYGFGGELRAIGDVLIDEIPLMLRCGFDSFEVTNAPTLHALKGGRLPGSPLHYQPASARDEIARGNAAVASRFDYGADKGLGLTLGWATRPNPSIPAARPLR